MSSCCLSDTLHLVGASVGSSALCTQQMNESEGFLHQRPPLLSISSPLCFRLHLAFPLFLSEPRNLWLRFRPTVIQWLFRGGVAPQKHCCSIPLSFFFHATPLVGFIWLLVTPRWRMMHHCSGCTTCLFPFVQTSTEKQMVCFFSWVEEGFSGCASISLLG